MVENEDQNSDSTREVIEGAVERPEISTEELAAEEEHVEQQLEVVADEFERDHDISVQKAQQIEVVVRERYNDLPAIDEILETVEVAEFSYYHTPDREDLPAEGGETLVPEDKRSTHEDDRASMKDLSEAMAVETVRGSGVEDAQRAEAVADLHPDEGDTVVAQREVDRPPAEIATADLKADGEVAGFDTVLSEYRQMLVDGGFSEENIKTFIADQKTAFEKDPLVAAKELQNIVTEGKNLEGNRQQEEAEAVEAKVVVEDVQDTANIAIDQILGDSAGGEDQVVRVEGVDSGVSVEGRPDIGAESEQEASRESEPQSEMYESPLAQDKVFMDAMQRFAPIDQVDFDELESMSPEEADAKRQELYQRMDQAVRYFADYKSSTAQPYADRWEAMVDRYPQLDGDLSGEELRDVLLDIQESAFEDLDLDEDVVVDIDPDFFRDVLTYRIIQRTLEAKKVRATGDAAGEKISGFKTTSEETSVNLETLVPEEERYDGGDTLVPENDEFGDEGTSDVGDAGLLGAVIAAGAGGEAPPPDVIDGEGGAGDGHPEFEPVVEPLPEKEKKDKKDTNWLAWGVVGTAGSLFGLKIGYQAASIGAKAAGMAAKSFWNNLTEGFQEFIGQREKKFGETAEKNKDIDKDWGNIEEDIADLAADTVGDLTRNQSKEEKEKRKAARDARWAKDRHKKKKQKDKNKGGKKKKKK